MTNLYSEILNSVPELKSESNGCGKIYNKKKYSGRDKMNHIYVVVHTK